VSQDGAWVIDLDGVVWLAGAPIAGSAWAIAELRRRGRRVLFATNNSSPTRAEHIAALSALGIPASPEDILSSAEAAASLLAPGQTAIGCAGPGVLEALATRGVRIRDQAPADAVIVGYTRDFDYDRLAAASAAVRAGARLIGTNEDPTYPTAQGELPGAGALLAAVACAGGATPLVAGKPNGPMASFIRSRVGMVAVVVGDRPSTDGRLARRLGAQFALVLSGVTGSDAAARAEPAPDRVARRLEELVVALADAG
jgi:glycerol-1-phosphatase